MTPKSIADKINLLAQSNGLNHQKVFCDLLDYIIAGFDPEAKPIPEWTYSEMQTRSLSDIAHSYFLLMQEKLSGEPWYDAWGDLFMELVGHFAGYRGQFFTPGALTDPMSACVPEPDSSRTQCGGFGPREVISDPACGSGRTLLSMHMSRLSLGKERPYLIGEDLDVLCVKMAAINLCVHCCFGEVVCHDSLSAAGKVQFGYIVNEGMYPFPAIPSIRKFTDPSRFVCCR